MNHPFIGLPTTVGVMATALALPLLRAGLDALGIALALSVTGESALLEIDFSGAPQQGMLSLLPFAITPTCSGKSIDEILNAVLSVLIGLEEIVVMHFAPGIGGANVAAIAVTLFAGWLTMGCRQGS